MIKKPKLIILTNTYPGIPSKQEMWLNEELKQTHQNYSQIIVVPNEDMKEQLAIPGQNSKYLEITNKKDIKLGLADWIGILCIAISDILVLLKKGVFIRELRYNISLIKQMFQTSKFILEKINIEHSEKTIIYSYWADNLATCGSIIKKMRPDLIHVTRAHSYEIYEEQTKYGYIPFRMVQLNFLDKIYTDSYKGYLHLIHKHPKHAELIECSYVGVDDLGMNPFPKNTDKIDVVSCSYVRGQKRLHLFPEVLKHVKNKVTWHLIGEGPDLPQVKELCSKLPQNIEVKFLGYLDANGVIEYFRNVPLNLFISVSSIEGLPVSLIEAISFGIPILSTDVGGCNEICKEETGILIPKEFNPVQVAKQIDDFVNSNKNTSEFRKQVRKFWNENFNSKLNYAKFSNKICSIKI